MFPLYPLIKLPVLFMGNYTTEKIDVTVNPRSSFTTAVHSLDGQFSLPSPQRLKSILLQSQQPSSLLAQLLFRKWSCINWVLQAISWGCSHVSVATPTNYRGLHIAFSSRGESVLPIKAHSLHRAPFRNPMISTIEVLSCIFNFRLQIGLNYSHQHENMHWFSP